MQSSDPSLPAPHLIANPSLLDVVLLLAAAVAVVLVFKRLKASPVLGYLVAGGMIGPYGFRLVTDLDAMGALAEFGVVFLLFVIGLELTMERLRAMRTHVFGFGTLQMASCGAGLALAAACFGSSLNQAIIIGGGLALSSTAVVMQVLADRGEQTSQLGRLSLAALLLQDFAVVPLLVLVPLLATQSDNVSGLMLHAGLKALVALVLIIIAGRLLLQPVFRLIASARSEDLFSTATLLIVLAAAWATEHAGLSLALGAFLAGVLVAETAYHHQVAADIMPFKGIFLGLFFMSIGMGVDVNAMLPKLPIILAMTAGLLLIKGALIAALCRLFRFSLGLSLRTGLVLAQGGEFAFVLFTLAGKVNLLSPELAQMLSVTVTLSMAVTPLLADFGNWLANVLDKRSRSALATTLAANESSDVSNHIVIAGFGRMGQTVARMLVAEQQNFIILDTDPKAVTEGRKRGKPVYYGNASHMDVLASVGMERARAVVITVSDPEVAERIVSSVRRFYPDLPIIARARDLKQGLALRQAGASVTVPETFEASLQLGGALLRTLGTPDHEVSRVIGEIREDLRATPSEAEPGVSSPPA
ncbi:MAG: cation:proton antiporter [Alphaproteobacteria bacterium]|nr:cation:proton antiporter [Alphaproteobacteria bacterium]